MNSSAPVQRTEGKFGDGFKVYDPDLFDLIALHFWSDTTRNKRGRVTEIGKAPINASWSTMDVNSRRTRARCLAEGRNMGVRLKPTQLVLDVDPRNKGDRGFQRLCFNLDLDPDEWPRVLTGSSGWHCYMALPEGVPVQETLDGYAGLEFKSIGRQVVAAGSRHPNGNFYRWSQEHPSIRAGLPMIPTVLRNLIRRRTHTRTEAGECGAYSVELLAKMLERLPVKKFRDQDKWLRLMFACHHATAGNGEHAFVLWSVSDPDYEGHEEGISKRWQSCRDKVNAITYRTLNQFLREHGAGDLVPPRAVSDDEFPAIAARRTLGKVARPTILGRVRDSK